MSDSLARVAAGVRFYPSRIPALLNRGVVTGTKEHPKLTPKGKRVLAVCKRAANFQDPDEDKVPQKLPDPSNLGDILATLSGAEPPSIGEGSQAKVRTRRGAVSLPSSRGMPAARRGRTFGERMTNYMERLTFLILIIGHSILIIVYSLILLFLLILVYLVIRS
jgi:hypothetical protein